MGGQGGRGGRLKARYMFNLLYLHANGALRIDGEPGPRKEVHLAKVVTQKLASTVMNRTTDGMPKLGGAPTPHYL
jgi:hypothetical protein